MRSTTRGYWRAKGAHTARGVTIPSTPGLSRHSAISLRAGRKIGVRISFGAHGSLDGDFHRVARDTADRQRERLDTARRVLRNLHIHLIQPAAIEARESAERDGCRQVADRDLWFSYGRHQVLAIFLHGSQSRAVDLDILAADRGVLLCGLGRSSVQDCSEV